jgi:hypothetical protein
MHRRHKPCFCSSLSPSPYPASPRDPLTHTHSLNFTHITLDFIYLDQPPTGHNAEARLQSIYQYHPHGATPNWSLKLCPRPHSSRYEPHLILSRTIAPLPTSRHLDHLYADIGSIDKDSSHSVNRTWTVLEQHRLQCSFNPTTDTTNPFLLPSQSFLLMRTIYSSMTVTMRTADVIHLDDSKSNSTSLKIRADASADLLPTPFYPMHCYPRQTQSGKLHHKTSHGGYGVALQSKPRSHRFAIQILY